MTFRLSTVVVLSGIVLGCATPAPSPAPKRLQAIDANNRAAALFARGDYAGAVTLYRQALDIERSVEHEDGIAANLINLSIAHQRAGDAKAAARALAEVLEPGPLAFPPQRVAEAALRDAILRLDGGDAAAAERALERSRAACAKPCALEGRLLNVDAQLAILGKDWAAAGAAAARALEANRARGDRDEVANSLRLLGSSLLERNSPEKSEAALREALEIDKDLAVPARILRDLILLGRVAQARGDAQQARSYLSRAHAVAAAMRDERSVAEVARLASALPK